MEALFLHVLNLSITASYIVLAVLVLRLVLRRAPKWMLCALWALVAVRLACPFSLESALSLIPSAQTVNPAVIETESEPMEAPVIQSGFEGIDQIANEALTDLTFTRLNPIASADTLAEASQPSLLVSTVEVCAAIWLCGVAAMALYGLASWLILRRRVRMAVRLKGDLWQSETVTTPFVLGLIRPRVYLPFSMDRSTAGPVIAHERAHIRRHDPLWKLLGYALLSVYWFNPLLWLAYALFCKDIELACDENVVRNLTPEARKQYATALLSCGVNRPGFAACPVAFGEVGVKERIKRVMKYKKPALWAVIFAAVLCFAAAVCLLTDPVAEALEDEGKTPDSTKADDAISVSPTFSADTSENDHTLSDRVLVGSPLERSESGDLTAFYSPCGLSTTREHMALAEWNRFFFGHSEELLDEDDRISESDIHYEIYGLGYGVLADKLDEIAAKYRLRLWQAEYTLETEQELFDALGMDPFYPVASDEHHTINVYDDGSFEAVGISMTAPNDLGVVDFSINRAVRGSFSDSLLLDVMPEAMEFETYTTASGVAVDLALGKAYSLLFADMENCYISCEIYGSYEPMNDARELSMADLEAIAECIDFLALDDLEPPAAAAQPEEDGYPTDVQPTPPPEAGEAPSDIEVRWGPDGAYNYVETGYFNFPAGGTIELCAIWYPNTILGQVEWRVDDESVVSLAPRDDSYGIYCNCTMVGQPGQSTVMHVSVNGKEVSFTVTVD